MRTVTLEVRSPKASMADVASAWRRGKPALSAQIGFAFPELLWKGLAAKRWELWKALCEAGPKEVASSFRTKR